MTRDVANAQLVDPRQRLTELVGRVEVAGIGVGIVAVEVVGLVLERRGDLGPADLQTPEERQAAGVEVRVDDVELDLDPSRKGGEE